MHHLNLTFYKISEKSTLLKISDTTYFTILQSSQLFTCWHLYRALFHQGEATTTTPRPQQTTTSSAIPWHVDSIVIGQLQECKQ